MTDQGRARRTLLAALLLTVGLLAVMGRPAAAQTSTTSPSTDETITVPVAPGDTAPNGGPLLVPGDTDVSSGSAAGQTDQNSDNTGTVVALVISGLLVVALLLALLTYWFWRNTRPGMPRVSEHEDDDREPEGEGVPHG